MPTDEKINRAIGKFIQATIATDESAHGREFRAAKPLLVRQYGGTDQYWRVPLIDAGTNTPSGFLDIREDAGQPEGFTLVRYSLASVLPTAGAVESRSVTDLGSDEVVREAHDLIGPDAIAEEAPTLVYLGFETRVAWRLRMARPDGTAVDVFVTPGTAFVQP